MAGYCKYEVDKDKQTATITFDNVAKLNSFDVADMVEMRDRVIQAGEDDAVKVILFKAAGPHFGSGFDVSDLEQRYDWEKGDRKGPGQRKRLRFDNNLWLGRRGLEQTILFSNKATIAQVQGYCYGGHLHIALACDIVVASEDALFAHPGYRYIGPMGPIAVWILTIGLKRTKEIMLTGNRLTAKEALDWGLINRVVSKDKLEEETSKMVSQVTRMPFDAIEMGKANLEMTLDALGVGAGLSGAYIGHTLQTNIRYEPGEYNLMKAVRDKGATGGIREREQHFSGTPLAEKPR